MARRILLLSGLAILAVVANHAGGFGQIAAFLWTDRYQPVSVPNWDQLGTPVHYALLTIRRVGSFAVPAFLFIGGFFSAFAARGKQSASPWKGVGARVTGLLIPYLVWSAVIFLGDALQGDVLGPAEYLWRLLTVGAVGPYFYIPLLCYCSLLAPLIIPSVKARPARVLLIAALIQVVGIVVAYLGLWGAQGPVLDLLIRLTPPWSPFSWGVPYVLGMVACMHAEQVKSRLVPIKWWVAAATAVLFVLNIVESDVILSTTRSAWGAGASTLSYHLFSVAVLLTFIAFEEARLPGARRLSQLGKQSYGIYLLHYSIISFTARVVRQVAPELLAYQLLFVALLFALGLGGPLLLMTAVSRSPARRYYRYLFG
jgi:surface polysaccharide O-acyltransferase-like enzyme